MDDQLKLSKDGSRWVTDEVINAATHLAGAIFALAGVVLLVVKASATGKPLHIASLAVYGATLLFLLVASTLHHGVNASAKTERVLRKTDHQAVFLLIAGTYTPVCLVLARGPVGWSMFGVIWFLAVAGIVLKAAWLHAPRWLPNTVYLTMGWLGVPLVVPMARALPWQGTALFAAGGLIYSVGWVVYHWETPNPVPGRFGFHEIWHMLVIVAAVCHFLVMFFYVLPLK